jgi:hypothetical protein
MTTPINVLSDQDGDVYGVANYGISKVIGHENPVYVLGKGPVYNVGVDLHPVPDYIYRLRMNSLHGAVNNPTIITGVAKLDYKAIYFNGTNQSITEDDEASRLIGIENQFSVGVWVKPTAGINSVLSAMVTYGTSGAGGTGFQLVIPVNAALKARYISGAAGFNSNNDMIADDWNFILYTVNGTSRKIYLNGTLTTNTNTTNTFTSTTLRIATNASATSSFLDGAMDDLSVWNRELSSDEEALLRAYRS